jgi:hypothetical protein
MVMADMTWPTAKTPTAAAESRSIPAVKAWVEDVFPFITQDKVVLKGGPYPTIAHKAEKQSCDSVSGLFQETNTGYQSTKGRFVDQNNQLDGWSVRYIRLKQPAGVTLQLSLPGKIETIGDYLVWDREKNIGVSLTNWEIGVAYNRKPEVTYVSGDGGPAPVLDATQHKWPRFFEVWTTIGNQNIKRHVPLVWWRCVSAQAVNAVSAPDKNGCYTLHKSQRKRGAVFYGDGDTHGRDTGWLNWSTPAGRRTNVGFIPVGSIEGQPVGPVTAKTNNNGCAAGSGYHYDLFGINKNRIYKNVYTLASGPSCVSAPGSPGTLLDQVTLQRDYITSAEQTLFKTHHVKPLEYKVTLKTGP